MTPTPPALIPCAVPDLRAVPLGDLASPQAVPVLAAVVERVLPGRPVVTVSMAGFSSAL